MTSGRNTNPAKPVTTRLVTREAEGVDGIEKALDKLVRYFLDEISDQRIRPGMDVIMTLKPSWWLTEDGQSKFPTLTEEKTAELVVRAKSDARAYDAASYLAAVQFSFAKRTGLRDCPDSLVSFAASVLYGDLKRPTPKGRPHGTDIPLMMVQYALCHLVAGQLRVPLGRNGASRDREKSRRLSACDLVAEAFGRAGRKRLQVEPKKLESLCYDKGYRDLRELAKASGLLDHRAGIIWLGERPASPDK
jgi:hypothetical protein